MRAFDGGAGAAVPGVHPPTHRAGAADHAVSSSTTRGATATFIPDLLGAPPDGRPWAELWLGTHPNGPATLADGRPLRRRDRRPLPYLLKVLAAAEPLSLQTHPTPRAGRGRVRRRPLPGPRAEARAAVRADPVRGVLRRPARRRDARAARRARRRRAGRPPSRDGGPGAALDGAVPRAAARRARSSRAAAGERPPGGAVGAGAGRPLPRRSERRRDAAAQPRRSWRPARPSSSDPATSTPTSAAPASS